MGSRPALPAVAVPVRAAKPNVRNGSARRPSFGRGLVVGLPLSLLLWALLFLLLF